MHQQYAGHRQPERRRVPRSKKDVELFPVGRARQRHLFPPCAARPGDDAQDCVGRQGNQRCVVREQHELVTLVTRGAVPGAEQAGEMAAHPGGLSAELPSINADAHERRWRLRRRGAHRARFAPS